jgi:two-component system, NtrC family, sensor histidine kinase HydH
VASDKYAQLAELAGGFIHEIKNHLSTLSLNIQLLAEDLEHPESPRERRAAERVQRLQGECQRLVNVANDFLRFARIDRLELEPANLLEIIEEMIDFFGPTARQANITIHPYLPANLPQVRLDSQLFKQALLNLLLNAEQAMPSGGELVIQASHSPGPAGAGTVLVSLIDTGVGMSPEALTKVFRPFFSTKQGGTGLGLPTTKKIIEAHGGIIEVQSEMGKGTKFTLKLPVWIEALPLDNQQAVALSGSLNR